MTYRCGGLVVTGLVTFALTRRMDLAASVAFLDTIAKIGVFYLHERCWLRIEFGKLRPPDYQI